MPFKVTFRLAAWVTAVGAAILAAPPSSAQREPLPPPAPPSAAAAGTAAAGPDFSDLLSLTGPAVEVRYAPDALDRAARIQMQLVAVRHALARLTRAPLDWTGVLLDAHRWNAAGLEMPWGLPERLGAGTFLLPAAGDDASVAMARRLVGAQLPKVEAPLVGSEQQAASLVVADTLVELDLARAFVESARLSGDEPWVSGVLVALVARYSWEGTEPQRMLEIVGLFDRMAALRGGPRARRLADYRGGLPYDDDLWYQAQFVRGADAIWVAEGARGTAHLLKRLARDGVAARRSDLEKRYPALLDWEHAAFAP